MHYISLLYCMSDTHCLVCVVIASLYYLVFCLELLEHGCFYVCFISIFASSSKTISIIALSSETTSTLHIPMIRGKGSAYILSLSCVSYPYWLSSVSKRHVWPRVECLLQVVWPRDSWVRLQKKQKLPDLVLYQHNENVELL